MKIEALVLLSVPGTFMSAKESRLLCALRDTLGSRGIKADFVDSVPGWGCLNQDWLEFSTEIDTSWGWCKIPALADAPCEGSDWSSVLAEELHQGRLLMQLYYRQTGELIPHC